MADVRKRAKAVTQSPEQQAQEIEQRRIAHEAAKKKQLEALRQQHEQNIQAKQYQMSDDELLKKDQQDKKFQKGLDASQQNVENVEQDIVNDIEQENQAKQKINKPAPTLDL